MTVDQIEESLKMYREAVKKEKGRRAAKNFGKLQVEILTANGDTLPVNYTQHSQQGNCVRFIEDITQ